MLEGHCHDSRLKQTWCPACICEDMTTLEVNPAAQASLQDPPAPVLRPEHAEGEIARLIEQQTAKIPSHWFLVAAVGAMGVSLVLELAGRRRPSRFIGMWPTPLLVAGIYNKMVKTLGTR
jgi:hypothetical protein